MKGLRTSKSKTNKIIAAMITAAVMVATAAVSISASDYVAPIDWGWGMNTISYNSKPNYMDIFTTTDAVLGGNAQRDLMYMFGIKSESGYTYTLSNTFHIDGDMTYIKKHPYIDQVAYRNNLNPDYSYSNGAQKRYKLDNFTDTILVTLDNNGNGDYKLTVVYNPDKAGISYSDVYLFISVFSWYSTYYANLNLGNEIITCVRDIDGTIFEKTVLDTLSEMQQSDSEFYTNALDVLNSIYNYGSDYPIPDEAAKKLNNSVSSMSSAESALSSKSDQLMSEVSDTWSSNKQDVKSYAATLKPAAAQVNQLFLSITSSLPTEVKILFVVIPMLLFIGWLIGRIDK